MTLKINDMEVDILFPQMYRSTNRRGSVLELEIWFRIVHITHKDAAGFAAYREQTVDAAIDRTLRISR